MSQSRAPGWERVVLGLLDDLEQQAEGLALAERDLEVADRSRTEYARITLVSRLHALPGRRVRLLLRGGLDLAGTVRRTGADWLLLADDREREWVVPHGALGVVRGAGPRSVADEALGVVRRLTVRSVLRGVVDSDPGCVLHLVDGSRHEATLIRVGADFLEVALAGAATEDGRDLVPLAALAAVQRR